MTENLMNSSHIATSEAYRNNYDRVFGKKFIKDCPYFVEYGVANEDHEFFCQAVQRVIPSCHEACLQKESK